MSASSPRRWRCRVCGYEHEGDAPPDDCPLCGAPRSAFELKSDPPARKPETASGGGRRWRCGVCGYIHEGDEPPDECPVCGAGPDDFEAIEGDPEQGADDDAEGEARTIVIVGGGIAAISAAEAARKTSSSAEIVLLSGEPGLPYNRLNLTRLLAGEMEASDLSMHPQDWYDERRIALHCGRRAVRLSLDAREVHASEGGPFSYDKLILATGADAFVPPMPGADLDGVFTLRTLEDANALLAAMKPGARCVVIGGGILGLETAGALARRKGDVTLLEGSDHLMPRQLAERPSGILAGFVRELGIRLRTGVRTDGCLGDPCVSAVKLEGGERIPADLVVIATGVRSSVGLAKEVGLKIDRGVTVDDQLRSSHADLYACGDVCAWKGVQYGSWAAAQAQGTVAGGNAAGRETPFPGMPRMHTLKVLGLDMVSIGQFEPESDRDRVVEDDAGRPYRRFVLRAGKLVGAILLDDVHLASAAAKAVEEERAMIEGEDDQVGPDDVAKRLESRGGSEQAR